MICALVPRAIQKTLASSVLSDRLPMSYRRSALPTSSSSVNANHRHAIGRYLTKRTARTVAAAPVAATAARDEHRLNNTQRSSAGHSTRYALVARSGIRDDDGGGRPQVPPLQRVKGAPPSS